MFSPFGFVVVVGVIIILLFLFSQEKKKLRNDYQKYKEQFRTKHVQSVVEVVPDNPPLSPESLWKQLVKLNLSFVETKLRETEKRWSEKRIANALTEYRKFLYVCGVHGDTKIVPQNTDVDKVWHQHILQMKKYEADCQRLFGKVLYHTPVASLAQNARDEERTKMLYRRSFCSPKNAPTSVTAGYNNASEVMPWWLWWNMYASEFSGSSSVYNDEQHSFQYHHTPSSERTDTVLLESFGTSSNNDSSGSSSESSASSSSPSCSSGSASCSSASCSSSS